MKKYVLSIDQGTTGTFVALMNQNGETVSKAYKAHSQINPQPDWIEQDPEELWRNACELINQVVQQAHVQVGEIAGIGIANQGESVLMWDRQTGQPVYNVLVWQDTRRQAFVEAHADDRPLPDEVTPRTLLKLVT